MNLEQHFYSRPANEEIRRWKLFSAERKRLWLKIAIQVKLLSKGIQQVVFGGMGMESILLASFLIHGQSGQARPQFPF